jgi:predicted DNA-binding ribbon-helix-helix protein
VQAPECGHNATVRKRSVTINGHRTSISLEDAFWSELIGICRDRRITINALVAEVDRNRSGDDSNLSSALRIFILRELKKQHALQGAGLLVV